MIFNFTIVNVKKNTNIEIVRDRDGWILNGGTCPPFSLPPPLPTPKLIIDYNLLVTLLNEETYTEKQHINGFFLDNSQHFIKHVVILGLAFSVF